MDFMIETSTKWGNSFNRRDCCLLYPSRLSMKTVVQNEVTLLYLAEAEQWTPNLNQARSFGGADEAMAYVRAKRLKGCSVLQTYGTPFPDRYREDSLKAI
jgi:hypothetical protein